MYYIIGKIDTGTFRTNRAFRVIDTSDNVCTDFYEGQLIDVLQSQGVTLANAVIENGSLKGTNGDLARYGWVGAMNNKDKAIVILQELHQNGALKGYTVCDADGNIKHLQLDTIFKTAVNITIANGAFVQTENSIYIRPINGSYPIMTIAEKRKQVSAEKKNLGITHNMTPEMKSNLQKLGQAAKDYFISKNANFAKKLENKKGILDILVLVNTYDTAVLSNCPHNFKCQKAYSEFEQGVRNALTLKAFKFVLKKLIEKHKCSKYREMTSLLAFKNEEGLQAFHEPVVGFIGVKFTKEDDIVPYSILLHEYIHYLTGYKERSGFAHLAGETTYDVLLNEGTVEMITMEVMNKFDLSEDDTVYADLVWYTQFMRYTVTDNCFFEALLRNDVDILFKALDKHWDQLDPAKKVSIFGPNAPKTISNQLMKAFDIAYNIFYTNKKVNTQNASQALEFIFRLFPNIVDILQIPPLKRPLNEIMEELSRKNAS